MFSLNRGSTMRSNELCAQIRLGIHFQSSQTLKQLWHHLSGVSGTSVTQTWRELWDFISVTVCNIIILKSNRENFSKMRCTNLIAWISGVAGSVSTAGGLCDNNFNLLLSCETFQSYITHSILSMLHFWNYITLCAW